MSRESREEQEFIQQVLTIDTDAAVKWVTAHKNPEDVFAADTLDTWARENGYEKPEEVAP